MFKPTVLIILKYSQISKLNTVRVIISIATNKGQPLDQTGVKNAFLHSDLHKVYMQQPPRFAVKWEESEVCLLKKSIYDFKQSPRSWFERFDQVVITNGLKRGIVDPVQLFSIYYSCHICG